MVKVNMVEAIKTKPNPTAKDLMNGDGMGYNLSSMNFVASDILKPLHRSPTSTKLIRLVKNVHKRYRL